MKETMLLSHRLPQKLRVKEQATLDKSQKIVFDPEQPEPLNEFLSTVEECYPGLRVFSILKEAFEKEEMGVTR
jgi:hypothetical protein